MILGQYDVQIFWYETHLSSDSLIPEERMTNVKLAEEKYSMLLYEPRYES